MDTTSLPENCQTCGLYKTSVYGNTQSINIPGSGLKNAKIMFVIEAPGQEEVALNKTAVGSEGRELDARLLEVGLKRGEVYVTYVCKCRTPDNRPPKSTEIKECQSFLLKEIEEINPSVICAMGSTPLQVFMKRKGLQTIRGTINKVEVNGKYYKVIPTYRPAYILKWPEYPHFRDDLLKDLKLVKLVSENPDYKVEKHPTQYSTLNSVTELKEFLIKCRSKKVLAYDIETVGFNFMKDEILSIGLSCELYQAVGIYFKDFSLEDQKEIWKLLKEILESKDVVKVAHNAKFDNKFLRRQGIVVKLPMFDTMLAHFLINENSERGLKYLAFQYTDMGGYDAELDSIFKEKTADIRKGLMLRKKEGEIDEEEYQQLIEESKNYGIIPKDILMKYNMADADCTLRLYQIFQPLIEKESLDKVFYYILMPMCYVYTEVEFEGVQVDKDFMQIFGLECKNKVEELMTEFLNSPQVKKVEELLNKGLSPEDKKYKKFNMNSSQQLQKLLFEVARLPYLIKTKTGYSTDKTTLDWLSKKSDLANKILAIRKVKHDLNTYVAQLIRNMDERGRAHTDYRLDGSVSGRIISAKPNLQNIPRDSKVKRLFIADPGSLFLEADYSQVEYRMWANCCGCPIMLNDIRNGLCIHSEVACEVWPNLYKKVGPNQYLYTATGEIHSKVGVGKVAKEHRTKAKNVVFGLMFGRGPKSLMEEYKLSEQEVKKIISWFFGKYSKASEWLEEQKRMVKVHKQVKNIFGRVRRLPEVDSREEEKRAEVMRQAVNTPIQGGASDVVSLATIRTYNYLKKAGLKSRIILSIHDSLKFSVPFNELDKAKELITKGMTEPIPGVNFPLEVEFEIGTNWQNVIGWDEYFEPNKDKYLKEWGFIK